MKENLKITISMVMESIFGRLRDSIMRENGLRVNKKV